MSKPTVRLISRVEVLAHKTVRRALWCHVEITASDKSALDKCLLKPGPEVSHAAGAQMIVYSFWYVSNVFSSTNACTDKGLGYTQHAVCSLCCQTLTSSPEQSSPLLRPDVFASPLACHSTLDAWWPPTPEYMITAQDLEADICLYMAKPQANIKPPGRVNLNLAEMRSIPQVHPWAAARPATPPKHSKASAATCVGAMQTTMGRQRDHSDSHPLADRSGAVESHRSIMAAASQSHKSLTVAVAK